MPAVSSCSGRTWVRLSTSSSRVAKKSSSTASEVAGPRLPCRWAVPGAFFGPFLLGRADLSRCRSFGTAARSVAVTPTRTTVSAPWRRAAKPSARASPSVSSEPCPSTGTWSRLASARVPATRGRTASSTTDSASPSMSPKIPATASRGTSPADTCRTRGSLASTTTAASLFRLANRKEVRCWASSASCWSIPLSLADCTSCAVLPWGVVASRRAAVARVRCAAEMSSAMPARALARSARLALFMNWVTPVASAAAVALACRACTSVTDSSTIEDSPSRLAVTW